MLVPMVLAETILASEAFSLINHDQHSEKWDNLSHVCGIILGIFFIIAAVYIVVSYVPTIDWRGPIDYISIWAYVLGIIPAALLLLGELGVIFKGLDTKTKNKRHIVIMIFFILFTHLAMVFGMADPQLAGYVPPKQQHMQMDMNMPMSGGSQMKQDGNQQMDHSQMQHKDQKGQMDMKN